EYYPWILPARKALAFKLWEANRHNEAIAHLKDLACREDDNDPSISLQVARAYLQVDQSANAIATLESIRERIPDDATLPILLATAKARLGQQQGAFTVLQEYRQKFWNQTQFLFAYLEAAYAAGREREAREALQELNSLRERGQIDPKQFRLGSIEEIRQLVSG